MRIVLLACLLAGCVLAQVANTPGASSTPADPMAEGLKALDAKQYPAAIQFFTQAAAADPQDYAAAFHLGLAYSLANRDAEAIAPYRKTLELKPGTHQAELNLGMSLYNTAQYAEAAEWYAKAALSNPKSADAELGVGRALAHLDKRAEAEPHYRAAVKLDPSTQEYLLELATLCEEHGDSERAIALFSEFPANPGAVERKGALLLKTGKFAESVATLEPLVAQAPTTANRIALAEAYVKAGQGAKAEPLVAQALAAEPNDFELRFFYGQLLRDQRKFPQAAEQFLKAAQMKPDAAGAWTELAGMLVMQEQFPQALAALDQVRKLHAEIAGHHFLRAISLDRLQQRKEALEAYQEFLKASGGKNPDQEFQARGRIIVLQKDLGKR